MSASGADDPQHPWTIQEDGYPRAGTPVEQLRFCLGYALLAPSSHNTQPWLFQLQGETVRLYLDPSRRLAVADPAGREAVISCGAALMNLRLAIRRFGHAVEVTLPFPAGARRQDDPSSPELLAPKLLAIVRRGPPDASPRPEEERLFRAIPRRRTNRHPFPPDGLPEGIMAALSAAAIQEGAWLEPVHGEHDRLLLADLIAEGDRQQWRDPRFRQELASWIHPNRTSTRDGMPGSSLGIGDVASFFGPLVVRTFDRGDGQAATDHQLATGSPALAVVGTRGDFTPDWLGAGQALERVLLRATADGLAASCLNQPVQVPELRRELATLLDHRGYPQVILRLGYGVEVQPTPRRRLDDVLLPPAPTVFPSGDLDLPAEPAA